MPERLQLTARLVGAGDGDWTRQPITVDQYRDGADVTWRSPPARRGRLRRLLHLPAPSRRLGTASRWVVETPTGEVLVDRPMPRPPTFYEGDSLTIHRKVRQGEADPLIEEHRCAHHLI